jgi:acyl-CoA synthetase (NDP forming)
VSYEFLGETFSFSAPALFALALVVGLIGGTYGIGGGAIIAPFVAAIFGLPIYTIAGAALMGAGGGPSVLASDEMEKEGLRVPCLSPGVQAELKQSLPVAGSIFANPLDTPNLIVPEAISTAMQVLGRVPEIHMLIYHLGFHPISRWGLGRLSPDNFVKPAVGVMKEAQRKTGKPILLALRPPQGLDGMMEFLAAQKAFVEAGFPVFYSMRHLARAMVRVNAWNGTSPDSRGYHSLTWENG